MPAADARQFMIQDLAGVAASIVLFAPFLLAPGFIVAWIFRLFDFRKQPAIWQMMADSARGRGEIPWQSMETPPRPPMLPLFGQVRAWMMTAADIARERPGPPPSTSSQQMAREVAEVRRYVDDGTPEELAIANFWNDGPSTPAPPGHWNLIAHRTCTRQR